MQRPPQAPICCRRVLLVLFGLALVAWLAAGEQGGQPSPGRVQHVYVIGCGHSGSTLLLRTIAALPHVRCVPFESYLYATDRRAGETRERKLQLLAEWDQAAAAGGFQAWVEKTPNLLPNDLALLSKLDATAKLIVVVRDGRDMVASVRHRPEESKSFNITHWADFWAKCAAAPLPLLRQQPPKHPVMLVKFEDLVHPNRVLDVLRRINEFIGVAPGVGNERLLFALQPPLLLQKGNSLCQTYAREAHKEVDLAGSYMRGLIAQRDAQQTPEESTGRPSRSTGTFFRRRDQMQQAWFPVPSIWRERFSAEEQRQLMALPAFQAVLRAYNYTA